MRHFCSFSEAIREGAKLAPQAFNLFLREGATCAMGAGIHACLDRPVSPFDFFPEALREFCWNNPQYKYLVTTQAAPPCGCEGPLLEGCVDLAFYRVADNSLNNLIVHLNNHHRWTREAIADWLETEEEKLGFVHLVESESSSPVEQIVSV